MPRKQRKAGKSKKPPTPKGRPARCPTGRPCPHCDGIVTQAHEKKS